MQEKEVSGLSWIKSTPKEVVCPNPYCEKKIVVILRNKTGSKEVCPKCNCLISITPEAQTEIISWPINPS